MTYQDTQANFTTLQSIQGNVQSVLDVVQPLVDSAQTALSAFHRYTIDWTPTADTAYSNLQLPDDAVSNGYQVYVIRDSMPDSVPCQISHYDTSALTWGDAIDSSLGWSDVGQP